MVKTPRLKPKSVEIRAAWSDPRALDVIWVDEMQVYDVEDRLYLTFGQVRLPNTGPNGEVNENGNIQSMVRLAISRETLRKMTEALSRVYEDHRDEEKKP